MDHFSTGPFLGLADLIHVPVQTGKMAVGQWGDMDAQPATSLYKTKRTNKLSRIHPPAHQPPVRLQVRRLPVFLFCFIVCAVFMFVSPGWSLISFIIHSQFTRSQFIRSQFIHSQFIHSQLSDSQFIDSQFIDSQLIDSQLIDSQFIDSSFIHLDGMEIETILTGMKTDTTHHIYHWLLKLLGFYQ